MPDVMESFDAIFAGGTPSFVSSLILTQRSSRSRRRGKPYYGAE